MSTDERPEAAREWAMGDYPEIARRFLGLAAHVAEAAGIQPGMAVADLAAGTGDVAVAAAERGALVEASDIAPELVEVGRARTSNMAVEWQVADVRDLPYPDDSFDVVMSALGLMFAPDPEAAAAEAFRILRPGGTFVNAAWTPEGYFGRMAKLLREQLAPGVAPEPPGPLRWGDERVVRHHIGDLADEVRFERGAVRWAYPSLEAGREFQERAFPSLEYARETMPPETYRTMVDTMMAFAASQTLAGDGRLVNDVEYLIVAATKA